MAVQVEDHPLDYADFEGDIPPGHYGAGHVIVWDRGAWTPVGDVDAGLRDGKLRFMLHGEKLHGAWTLLRMDRRERERQPAWLLIKERDDAARSEADYSVVNAEPDSVLATATASRAPAGHASQAPAEHASQAPMPPRQPVQAPKRAAPQLAELPALAVPAALPASFSPALATLVDTPPADGGWIYEVKFDGYRLLSRIENGEVQLLTRQGHDWTARLPALAQALRALPVGPAWLDGELVAMGEQGLPDFQALQNAFDAQRSASLQYFLFDLPYCAGHDLRRVPLRERRALLADVLARTPVDGVHFSATFGDDSTDDIGALVGSACELRLEGLIGKRIDGPYPAGRSREWIKLKCARRQEFVIGGYTDPRGARTGLGSLLLGVHDAQGALRYAGNVGTGFGREQLGALRAQLDALARPTSPFAGRTGPVAGVHWVEPELVAEVAFAEWTQDQRVRQAVFKGLRTDKPAAAIVRETPQPGAAVEAKTPKAADAAASASSPAAASATGPTAAPTRATAATAASAAQARQAASASVATAPRARRGSARTAIRITHPERVIDASTGATKRDLYDYCDRASELLLPHLRDRPVALLRAPDGVGSLQFFQKHSDGRQLPGVRTLDASLDPGHEPLFGIATRDGLLGAAQMNTIEFHTWNATVKRIEKPDRMVFDLDPGEGIEWKQVV
jgi:bifunctional non-homologous end joining protein LigD